MKFGNLRLKPETEITVFVKGTVFLKGTREKSEEKLVSTW